MLQPPRIYARWLGGILEVATDRLTLRSEAGGLVAIEDYLRQLFAAVVEIRVMTMDEAPWILAQHALAPPLQRVG
jgi:hypothetical protein